MGVDLSISAMEKSISTIGKIVSIWNLLMSFRNEADQAPEILPWKVNKPIVSVKKELYAKHPRPGAAALASIQYVGPNLEQVEYQGLEVVSDAAENHKWRFSHDNGRTWEPFQPLID